MTNTENLKTTFEINQHKKIMREIRLKDKLEEFEAKVEVDELPNMSRYSTNDILNILKEIYGDD